MKVIKFEDHDEWLESRKTRITGTRLKNVVTLKGNGKKIGYYELIAERLAIAPNDDNPMQRGNALEPVALARFQEETGKTVDNTLMLWTRDDNPSIAISPDGVISETEAVEVKCLSSARHIEAFLTQAVPKDYKSQVLQYFIVNDELETLYLAFFDPRFQVHDFFYLTINREDVWREAEFYLDYQRNVLKEVNEIVNKLSF